MRAALQKKPSLELTQRLQGLLRALDNQQLTAEDLRAIRAVEAVEAMRTEEARRLLRDWAGGAAGVCLTEEAKAALDRVAGERR
jgi:hypothetical protein